MRPVGEDARKSVYDENYVIGACILVLALSSAGIRGAAAVAARETAALRLQRYMLLTCGC